MGFSPFIWVLMASFAAANVSGPWRKDYPPWDEPGSRTYGHGHFYFGILGAFTGHECFPSWYMTIRSAVSHVNRRNSSVCPAIGNLTHNFQMTYKADDTQRNPTTSLMAGDSLRRDGATAILGPFDLETLKTTATWLPIFDMAVLSWQAGSTDSGMKFPTFFRVAPSQGFLMMVLASLMHHLQFRKVNVLNTDAVLHWNQARLLASAAQSLSIGVQSWSMAQKASNATLENVLRSVRSSTCRVTFVSCTASEAAGIWTTARAEQMMTSEGWVWFGTQEALGAQVGMKSAIIFSGAIFVQAHQRRKNMVTFEDMWLQHMASTKVPEFVSMPLCWWNRTCAGLKKFTGWVVGKDDKSLRDECRPYAAYAYDSVVALALSIELILSGAVPSIQVSAVKDISRRNVLVALRALFQPGRGFSCLSGTLDFDMQGSLVVPVSIRNWQAHRSASQQVAMHYGDPNANYNFVWEAGAQIEWLSGISNITNTTNPPNIPKGLPHACIRGSLYDFKIGLCSICKAGSYESGNCLPCPAGKYQTSDGMTACEACPTGRFLAVTGSKTEACELCPPGKFTRNSGSPSCTECAPGSYNPYFNQTACEPCPLGGLCVAAATGFVAQPQFYLKGRFSNLRGPAERVGTHGVGPWECIVPEACIGNNTCATGMKGFMCGECQDGYQRRGHKDMCSECPETWINILGFVAIVVGFAAVVVVLDMMNAAVVGTVSGVSAVVTKVLCNFFVMLSAISKTIQMDQTVNNLSGGSGASKVFVSSIFAANGASKAVANPQRTMLSLTCLLQEFESHHKTHYSMVVLGWLLIPTGLLSSFILIVLYYLLRPRARGKHGLYEATRTYFKPIGVVVIYFLHPIATTQFLSVFSCVVYDESTDLEFDTPRLLMNLNVLCDTEEHSIWLGVSALGMSVFSFGIPLLFWYRLRMHLSKGKGTLFTIENLRSYGFLMDGFEPSCYYYESLFMIRRVCFLICALPNRYMTNDGRVVLLLFLSCFFMALHLFYRPFDNRAYNGLDRLETISLLTLIVCLFGRLWEVTMRTNADVLKTVEDVFGDKTMVLYLPSVFSVIWLLVFTLYLYLRSSLWPMHDFGSPWLPTRCNKFFNRRLLLSLVPPLRKSELDGPAEIEHEHVTLDPAPEFHTTPSVIAKSSRSYNGFLMDREHFLLKTFISEAVEIILKRHELCYDTAAESIYVPTFLLQLERLFAVCVNMVLKERLVILLKKEQKELQKKVSSEEQEVKGTGTGTTEPSDSCALRRSDSNPSVGTRQSSGSHSRELIGRTAASIGKSISNLEHVMEHAVHDISHVAANVAHGASDLAHNVHHGGLQYAGKQAKDLASAGLHSGLKLGKMAQALAVEMIIGGGFNEEENPELFGRESIHIEKYLSELRKPVSMEEVHNELMMLTPRLLDKQRVTEGNMLQRMAGAHVGLFDHSANVTRLFDLELHRKRILETMAEPVGESSLLESDHLREGLASLNEFPEDEEQHADLPEETARPSQEEQRPSQEEHSSNEQMFTLDQDEAPVSDVHSSARSKQFFGQEFWGHADEPSQNSD